MLDCQRTHFRLSDDVAYLNCAFMAPQLRAVADAAHSAIERTSTPWKITASDFFEPVETLRAHAARLFAEPGGAATPDDIAIVPSASYGIAVAAQNIPVSAGDRIVVLAEQFPSHVYAWRDRALRASAQLVTVPRPADDDWTAATVDSIDARTRVVAVPNCHWTDGTLVDLPAVSQRARDVGAALVIDATQSLGAYPLDLSVVQPDFVVAAAYKWLLGPYGMAFLYVAPRWQRDGRPLEHNWITRKDSHRFDRLVEYRDDLEAGARRFDVGERSNFLLVPTATAALEALLGWGVASIQEYARALTDRIVDGAAELGLSAAAPSRRVGHIVGLRPADGEPWSASPTEQLAERGVSVSVRGSAIRVSPNVHNDERDVERLLDALAAWRAGR